MNKHHHLSEWKYKSGELDEPEYGIIVIASHGQGDERIEFEISADTTPREGFRKLYGDEVVDKAVQIRRSHF